MTLIVDILARAGRQCSVSAPSSWVTATDLTSLEVRDFLDETVTDILDRIDVSQPVSKIVTITADGGETYALPADFYRVHRTDLAVYEVLRNQRGAIPISDDGQWTYLQDTGFGGGLRYFRIRGYDENYEIDLLRAPESGLTFKVGYVSDEWIVDSLGVQKDEFTAEDDVCLLPRKLVEKGIVWRFLERKGLDFGAIQTQYEMLLARYTNDSKTRRAIAFGTTTARSPWDVPVPDYIPPAP